MMKIIMAVIGDGNATPVLEASLQIARRFGSHIIGLHSLTSEYAVVFGGEMGFSLSTEGDRAMEREGYQRRDHAHRLFGEFMAAHGVAVESAAAGHSGARASWRDEDGRQNAIVGMMGPVCDLIVLEQPDKLASIAEATLEDALFESGRPMLRVPKTVPAAIGDVVAVAWNGSTETATTIALSMPLLEAAKEVVVITVSPELMPEPGPTGEALAQTFDRHGFKVSLRAASGRQSRQGDSFLAEAISAGADLLIKGAYTQHRLRQMVFGGATRQIIMNAKIPVLLAR